MVDKKMFLNSINHFRGLSIVFIVASHCFGVSGWSQGTVYEKIISNIILGGTNLFVFISGFLFHHIFYKNFNYKRFISTKFKNIYSPYLIMSAFPICFYVFMLHRGPYNDYFFIHTGSLYYEFIRPVCLYLLTGGVITAYWYISFIMIVFLCSPMFITFIETRASVQLGLISAGLIVSMMIHRPVDNLNVLQSVIYFCPIYMTGMVASINRDYIYKTLAGKEYYLLLIVLLMSFIQVVVFNHYENFHKPPLELSVPDVMIIQKLALCLFFMVFLKRFEQTRIPVINTLAEASFAIFFIHPMILQLLYNADFIMPTKHYGMFSWLLSVILITFASYCVARCMKFVFGNRSRRIIGW